jgi:hypothetical protein
MPERNGAEAEGPSSKVAVAHSLTNLLSCALQYSGYFYGSTYSQYRTHI